MSACDRKRPYRSKKQAAGAASRVMNGPGKPPKLYTYRCRKCGKWHLTKMPPQDVMTARTQTVSAPSSTVLSPRRLELRRLISEANEIKNRWGGLVALLQRIERNDTLDDIGGEVEAIATAHNSAVERSEETAAVVGRLWALMDEQKPTAGAQRTLSGKSIERCILSVTAQNILP